jgi:hypothetical protein
MLMMNILRNNIHQVIEVMMEDELMLMMNNMRNKIHQVIEVRMED